MYCRIIFLNFMLFSAVLANAQTANKSDGCRPVFREQTVVITFVPYETVDTIQVKVYNRADSFSSPTDSFIVCTPISKDKYTDSLYYVSLPAISTDMDFEIILGDGSTYKISDIVVDRMRRGHNHYMCDVVSRKINGVFTYDGNIRINKRQKRLRNLERYIKY